MEIKDERTSGEGQGRGERRERRGDREKLDTLHTGSDVDRVNSSAKLQPTVTFVTARLRQLGKYA